MHIYASVYIRVASAISEQTQTPPPTLEQQLPSKLAGANTELGIFAATLQQRLDSGENPFNLHAKFSDITSNNNLGEVMYVGDYTAAELETALTSLSSIEEKLGRGRQSRTYEYILSARNSPALAELTQQEGSIVDRVLLEAMRGGQWEASPSEVKDIVRAVEYGTRARIGGIENWFKDREVVVDSKPVREVASASTFVKAYAQLVLERAEYDPSLTPAQKMAVVGKAEIVMFEGVLGISPEQSADLRLGADGRTMKRDDEYTQYTIAGAAEDLTSRQFTAAGEPAGDLVT